MPPKKQEEEIQPILPICLVLPIIFGCQSAQLSLLKPLSIMKLIDQKKIIDLLKEKNIEKFVINGKLTAEGRIFACENLPFAIQEFANQLKKPNDPKKDAKKDPKKDKKQQVIEEGEKIIQLDFPKNCSEFYFLNEIVCSEQQLETVLKANIKIDFVVEIYPKIKEGSKIPDYSLLNKNTNFDDYLGNLSEKVIASSKAQEGEYQEKIEEKLKIVKKLKSLRMIAGNNSLTDCCVHRFYFQNDLQHPENNEMIFLTNLFKDLSGLTLQKIKFEEWKKQQQIKHLVVPIKEIVRREVQVQEKKDDKKGGKKETQAAQTEMIEEVIQTNYEDLAENIRSDLKNYKRVDKQSTAKVSYKSIAQNLIISATSKDQSKQVSGSFLAKIHHQKQLHSVLNKVTLKNLQEIGRGIVNDYQELAFPNKFTFKSSRSEVTLKDMIQQNPRNQASLTFQYQMMKVETMLKSQEPKLNFSFGDRSMKRSLTWSQIDSLINGELEDDPKVYVEELESEGMKLLVLVKVNPPGRVLFKNDIFDWKVLPNFEHWQKNLLKFQKKETFLNYDWRQAGNLAIKSKKMMPTDNMIISENYFLTGDQSISVITFKKRNVTFGIKTVPLNLQHSPNSNVFWKHCPHVKTYIYEQHLETNQQEKVQNSQLKTIKCCFERETEIMKLQPYPTIFWSKNASELKRSFGAKGEITKHMRDGSVMIYYPSGDTSTYAFGKWQHVLNNKLISQDGIGRQLSLREHIEGQKTFRMREDETIFITFLDKSQQIIFGDGTILKKQKSVIEIQNENGIVVRIRLPSKKDVNVIGFGSAFAYLGFKNILERSYDGYLFEVWTPHFSTHYYIETYELNHQIHQTQIRLIAYRDGSILKVQSDGQITILNQNHHPFDEKILSARWLQLFTFGSDPSDSLYNAHLFEGWIKTKDVESNQFQVSVNEPSLVKIAVSFNIESQEEDENVFGNGHHVPDQNYFLPAPTNSISPRIFVLYDDKTGEEILSQEQVSYLSEFKTSSSSTSAKQFYQVREQHIDLMNQSFSPSIDLQHFAIPRLLMKPQKQVNLIDIVHPALSFECLREIEWSRQFQNVKTAESDLLLSRKKRREELDGIRRPTSQALVNP